MFAVKLRHRLIYAPFFVAIALAAALAIYPFSGIGAANNTFTLGAAAVIFVGLVTGIVALGRAKTMRVWWRALIGLLYFPTVLLSALLAGL